MYSLFNDSEAIIPFRNEFPNLLTRTTPATTNQNN